MLQEEGSHSCPNSYLCVNLITRRDQATILEAEPIKLRNVATTSTAIVKKQTTFLDVIEAWVNYTGAFSLHYKVSFVDALIN